jgi:hypothetical protein
MKQLIFALLIIACGLGSGCKKDFLESSNPNQLTINSYYKTEADAIGAVNSVYAVMQHMNLFRQHQWLIYDGMSDDVAWAGTDDEPANAMFNFNFSATLAKSNEMWGTLYTGVFRANQVILNVGNMNDFPLKNRVLAEAKFLRGWYYFELLRGWGGVPKITEPLQGAQATYNFPRASKEEISDLIKTDLQFAEQNLPMKSEYSGSDIARATSGAASAYLGKLFLFQQQWAEAVTQFEKVINSNKYQLTAKYADNFSATTENNIESVFEIQFSGDGTGIWNSDDASVMNESNLLPVAYFNWVVLGSMYQFKRNQFYGPETAGRSPRYSATFTVNANGAPRIKKYVEFNTSDFRRSDVNIRDMRYADVLLMYAEALNEIDRTDDAKLALDLVIDRARQEFGLTDPSTNTSVRDLKTVQQLIDFGFAGSYNFSDDKDGIRNIMKYQRRVELMYEQKRYKDLVRWGDAPDAFTEWNSDNGGARVFVVGKHELFPIPDTEISGNEGISTSDQNPGYN